MALLDDFMTVLGVAVGNDGLVTRQLLRDAGIPAGAITRLARNDRALVRRGRGVYLVAALTDLDWGDYRLPLQRLDASREQAAFAEDPLHPAGGVLSHQSAAHLWGAIDLPRDVHVTTPRRRRLQGITIHTARLEPSQVVVRHGLPVTTVEQTTSDLAVWPMDGEHRSRWVRHCLEEGLLPRHRLEELLGDAAEGTFCWLDGSWW